MSVLGPLTLLSLLLAWPARAAECWRGGSPAVPGFLGANGRPAPKAPAPASGGFSAFHFGEDPGQRHTTTPDDRDFQNCFGRVGPTKPEGPEHEPNGETELPMEPEPGDGWKDPVPDGFPPAPADAASGASPGPGVTPVPAVPGRRIIWPGARRTPVQPGRPQADPAKLATGKLASRGHGLVEDPDDLKDAPAAVNPARYSLWGGLTRPLLLPKDKIRESGTEDLKTLGRRDYDEHILGAKSGAAVLTGDGSVEGERRIAAETDFPETPRFVTVELDLAGAGVAEAVQGIADASGFKLDERFPPSFLGKDKGRVAVQGWLPAGRMSEALSHPAVLRLESARSAVLSRPLGSGSARLLVGLRLPPGDPEEKALKSRLIALSDRTGFVLERAVAYQKIPGTERLVVVVAGRIPVREIGRLMAEEDVVKVLPSPVPPASPARARAPLKSPVGQVLASVGGVPGAALLFGIFAFTILMNRPRPKTKRSVKSFS